MTGNPIPARARICSERSLSRERVIATDSLRQYVPIICELAHNGRTRKVTDAPIRGITASKGSSSLPR